MCFEQLVLWFVCGFGINYFFLWSYIRQKWLYDWGKIIKNVMIARLPIAGSLIVFPFLYFQNLLMHLTLWFVGSYLLNNLWSTITLQILSLFSSNKTAFPDLFSCMENINHCYLFGVGCNFIVLLCVLFYSKQSRFGSMDIVVGIFFSVFVGTLIMSEEVHRISRTKNTCTFWFSIKYFLFLIACSTPVVTGVQLGLAILAACGTRSLLQANRSKCYVWSDCIYLSIDHNGI